MSPGDQLADDAPDSTCAQVIHTKPEKSSNRWVHSTETKECQEPEEQLGMPYDIYLTLAGEFSSEIKLFEDHYLLIVV